MTKNIFNRLKFCLMVCLASGPLAATLMAQEAVSNFPVVPGLLVVSQEQVVATPGVEQAAAVQNDVVATSTTNLEAEIGETNVQVETVVSTVETGGDVVAVTDEELLVTGESRSQRTARLNRNLMVGCSTVLSFFVICRLALIWQINRNRKKLPREENAFEN